MKNYAIDTKLLPEVWVTWLSSKGRIWMNQDGIRQNNAEWWMDYNGEYTLSRRRGISGKVPFGSTYVTRNEDRIWVNAGSQLYYAYAKYHKDIDRIELAVVKYDTKRSEGKHDWSYASDRLFIGRDKSVLNQLGIEKYTAFNVKKDTAADVKSALSMILRCTHNNKFTNEFKKFIGHNYYIIGNGTSVNIEYGWHLMKWYTSKQKTRSTGKSQKMVDELVEMPLGSIDGLEHKYLPRLKDRYTRYEDAFIRNILYFERINDEWSVLRALVREDNECFDEVWRVYLGDNGTNRITTKTDEGWVPSSQQKGWYNSSKYYFANEEEAQSKCDRIKYIAPILSSSEDVSTLITTLRFPCIEQLYKMGQKDIALTIARNSTPKAFMTEAFGGYYKDKEKNVLRQLGLTKHQLDMYCTRHGKKFYKGAKLMKRMRETLGDDLSHIDNDTFDKYFTELDELIDRVWCFRHIDMLDIDKGRFWKNLIRLNKKHPNSANLFNDTLSTYGRLDTKPEINWIFDDYSDIVRAHDVLVALATEQDRERRARWDMSQAERLKKDEEKRKKVDEERKHYEYEDENFIIRLPKDVNEIVSEGSKQSICIGGYTTRHSNGQTNLFFLRKKSEEDEPFYAIEMNNNKSIVQIHGHSNKWLGNNPEAIPTVVRWCRKHNIKCDTKILTCTARGYGRINNYIEMPKID
jgi:hypothetical protein